MHDELSPAAYPARLLRPRFVSLPLGQHTNMDLLTQGGPYGRHIAEAGGGFDAWLNDYLVEVLPTETPSLLSQNEGPAEMMPHFPPGDFLEDPLLDADLLGSVRQDRASSNSGEFSSEQTPAQLGRVSARTTSCVKETDKSAQKAARVAEKNRRAQKRFREREKVKKATLESQVAELSRKLAALSQEKTRLENRNNILEKVVKMKDEHITDLESSTPKPKALEAPNTLSEVLHDFYMVVHGGPCPCYDGRAIPMPAIQKTHKAYIDALAACLMEGAEDPADPAHERMCELIRADRAVMARVGLLSEKLYMTLSSQNVVPVDKRLNRPDAEHWKTVLDAMGLSITQKEAVLAASQELLARMQIIVSDRQPIVQAIASNAEGGHFSQQFERQEMIEQLQLNLKEEYRAVFDFEVALFQTVLKPLQQARMQVASYPWPVDTLAICALIAADRSHGNAQRTSSEGAQSMQADFTSLLTGLPEKSPFRMLAHPMPVT
ncbi:hypothetical protein COCOBI_05-5300 [Coccomyxa sp. Obi]|nr:hypothetical protein COCOBI_05-5300 [Coccomyxa sp. Obi]